MATAPVIWADSFMGYSTAQANRWYVIDAGAMTTISNTGGRGNRGYCIPGGATDNLRRFALGASYSLHIVSCAIYGGYGTNDRFIVGGQIVAGDGANGLNISGLITSKKLSPGLWTHVAIRVYRHTTAGTIDCWFNESNVLSASGLNTSPGTSTEIDFSGGY